jgi:hypothetical protein
MEFVPPRKVFQMAPSSPRARHEASTYDIPDFLYPVRTSSGGMASVYQGHPYPRKGFIYAEAVIALGKVKRFTLALFQSFTALTKGPRGFLNTFLYNYVRLVDYSLVNECERVPYLHYEYYCEFSKATWDFTYFFLRYLKVDFDTALRTGLILATMFENDDAYRFPLEDILSETTKEALLANPRKEIVRLVGIYKQRSQNFNTEGTAAGNRMESMARMATFLLLIPSVKRAFKFALKSVKFEWFQYDELDEYWALNRGDYQSFGLPLDVRKERQITMMIDYAQKMNPDKQIVRVDNEDGTVNINAIEHAVQ